MEVRMVFVLWFMRLQGFGELMAEAKLDLSDRRWQRPRASFTFLEASSQCFPPFDDRRTGVVVETPYQFITK